MALDFKSMPCSADSIDSANAVLAYGYPFVIIMDAAMSKTVQDAIAELSRDIAAGEAELNKKKETVNILCGVAGIQPQYKIEAADQPEVRSTFRSDEFFGEPLASSARKVLERSKATGGGAISLDDIYEALMVGGFVFDAKSDATAKRSLAISLGKNTTTFTRLPNGTYGLRRWYKNVPRQRAAANGADEVDEESAETVGEEDSVSASDQGSADTGESETVEGQQR